jgi:hypothetical protein
LVQIGRYLLRVFDHKYRRSMGRSVRQATIGAAVVALGGLFVMSPAEAATTATTTDAATTSTTTPPSPGQVRQADRFVRSERADSEHIQTAVEMVLLQLRSVAGAEKEGTASASSVTALTKAAEAAHDTLAHSQRDYEKAVTGSGNILADEKAVVRGGAGLTSSMATMITFTHSGNDTDLARFASQYNNGLLAWDGGIRDLWSIASAGNAPAIP